MLKELSYQVTFDTGRVIDRTINPEVVGTTLITGKNEAGKSLNLEMFAFTLFGQDALRGKKPTYVKLKARSTFEIKGVVYNVKRNKSGAELFDSEGETLAKGTTPVNDRIKRILGFGLDVFKISNWCAQGDIQKLAKMKPTERKQLIDEVSGLTQLDGVISWLKTVCKDLRVELNVMVEFMAKPAPVEKPEGLVSKQELNEKLESLEKVSLERSRLGGLVGQELAQPVKPQPRPLMVVPVEPQKSDRLVEPKPVEDFEKFGWSELSVRNCQAFISEMPRWAEQKASKFTYVQNLYNRIPEKKWDYTIEELDEMVGLHTLNDLNTRLNAEREALQAKGTVNCPECSHEHYVAQELLSSYQENYSVVDVALSLSDIALARQYVSLTFEYESEKAALQKHLDAIPMPQEDYDNYVRYQVSKEAYEVAQDKFKGLHESWLRMCTQQAEYEAKAHETWIASVKECRKTDIANELHYKESLALYEVALAKYNQDVENLSAHKEAYAKLDSAEDIKFAQKYCQDALTSWTQYETLLAQYERDLEKYNDQYTKWSDKETKLKAYQLASKALQEVKVRVKGYLVPSLSRVASSLLAEMTGGERCSIKISEDFEIQVDGQDLQTLSGSGQDITNLAIRIALGQVLTHKVMPLMMFDEIDAAMDQERANYTWASIQKVAPRIGQVLLVSHKDLKAAQTLKL